MTKVDLSTSPSTIKIIIGSELWFEVFPKDKEHLERLCDNNPRIPYRNSRLDRLRSYVDIETLRESSEHSVYGILLANFTIGEVLHCLNKGIEEVEDTEIYTLYHMRKMFNQSGSFTTNINGKNVKQNIWIEPGTIRFFSRDLISVCDGINWYKLDP